MTMTRYPLHPGQTCPEPLYCQIPLEEYEGLKKRIKELERDAAETHAMLEQRNKDVARLLEERRWRPYPSEKPKEDGNYIICGSSGYRNADRYMYCKDGRGMDFSFYSYGVKFWMPLPQPPEQDTVVSEAQDIDARR